MIELKEFLTAEVKEELKEAIADNHFKWIGDFGFFTYWEIIKNGQLYIFINNLWIEPEYRKKTVFFWIRKFLKNKYPDAKYGYWERRNKKTNQDEWRYSVKM